jgi:hypothetical protein
VNRTVRTAALLDANPVNTSIATFSGHAFDVFNPDSWVFDLDDIGQALSTTCRFGGHVEFYSVAEHCLRVESALEDWGANPTTRMIGLLHDAIEAYIGDIPRPIKRSFNIGEESVLDLEKSMELALFKAYDLLDDTFDARWAVVKEADLWVYGIEANERPKVGMGYMPYLVKGLWTQKYWHLKELIG